MVAVVVVVDSVVVVEAAESSNRVVPSHPTGRTALSRWCESRRAE